MRELHRFNHVILLGEGEVKHVEGSRVSFVDGSVADLDRLLLENVGGHQLRFAFAPELPPQAGSRTLPLGPIDEVHLAGGDLFFEILPAESDGSAVELVGSREFHSSTAVSAEGGRLQVETSRDTSSTRVVVGDIFVNGQRLPAEPIDGKVILRTGRSIALHVRSDGRGNGLVLAPLRSLSANIRGAARIVCAEVDDLAVRVTGSGSIDAATVRQSCVIEISGSGAVSIGAGEFDELHANISGSGSVSAAVRVRRADLLLRGSGSIWVAHVTEGTRELHGGAGSVSVTRRGQDSLQMR